jgi:hypothetical protein
VEARDEESDSALSIIESLLGLFRVATVGRGTTVIVAATITNWRIGNDEIFPSLLIATRNIGKVPGDEMASSRLRESDGVAPLTTSMVEIGFDQETFETSVTPYSYPT